MSAHVTPEELRAAERMARERGREVFTHLLRGCPECRARTQELMASPDPLQQARVQLLWRAAARAALRPLKGLRLCQALLERSWALRHDDPQGMIFLAELAADTAARLDPRLYGPAVVADAQARACGELANAFRVRDDFLEAGYTFDKAFRLLKEGTGDPALKARLHDLQASYFGTRREFSLAFKALDVVHALHLEMGDGHLAGRALITKALYTFYQGKTERALAINREGLSMIDGSRDPALVCYALHNQILFLIHDGHCLEARKFLFRNRPQVLRGGRINELKVRWLEGRISYGLGDLPGAETIFLEVRTGFESEGKGFAVALSLLDLSLVWLRIGRAGEAEEAVAHATELFFALKVPEVYSTVVVFMEALRLGKATVAFAEDVVNKIRLWEINPDTSLD